MSETTKKWNDEKVAQLLAAVGDARPVGATAVEAAAAALGVTIRSVAAKLRQLDVEVASMAKASVPTFSEEETASLVEFVNANAGILTYAQIAEGFADAKFSAKEIQGKLLALEMTAKVKPAEKAEAVLKYSDEQVAKFVELATSGAFLEDIAEALGQTLQSVRGKALSLTRSGVLKEIPKQKTSYAKEVVDPVAALGAEISGLTVAEIAKKVDKTERGIKTLLTRRGIKVADYDGAAKAAKAKAKA